MQEMKINIWAWHLVLYSENLGNFDTILGVATGVRGVYCSMWELSNCKGLT